MKYSNSSLIDYKLIVDIDGGRRTHKIDSVAIHCMGGKLSLTDYRDFCKEAGNASVNYGIDTEGKIALYVEEQNRAYATSDNEVDQRAISVIVASEVAKQPFNISNKAYDSLIKLLADICYRNDMTLVWANDKQYAITAAKSSYGPVDKQNIFLHKWFSTSARDCPGSYISTKLNDIVKATNDQITKLKTDAKKQRAEKKKEDEKEVPTSETVEVNIDYKTYTPYIITLDRDTKDLKKSELKAMQSAGVFGAIVEAGYLYTYSHNKVDSFKSPKAYDQIKLIHSLDMQHGYYMLARAHTVAEARAEMNELYYMVAKYPPALGMWLKLDLTDSVKTNNKIIDTYQDRLVEMGLKGKIGFYVTKKKLDQITWKDYQEDWLLWIVNHIKDLKSIDRLLDPEFFDMDGEG